MGNVSGRASTAGSHRGHTATRSRMGVGPVTARWGEGFTIGGCRARGQAPIREPVAIGRRIASDAGMFATTRWSLVLAARGRPSPEAQAALADLCRVYWYPLYAFVRRSGADAVTAEDLTQEFFARLLEKGWLDQADRTKGRFPSFLQAACKHFLANERDRARALKRGGGRTPLPIDFQAADDRYAREPAHELTPERLFERRFALALLEHVMAGLRDE